MKKIARRQVLRVANHHPGHRVALRESLRLDGSLDLNRLIRVASRHPELQPDLLPIIREAAEQPGRAKGKAAIQFLLWTIDAKDKNGGAKLQVRPGSRGQRKSIPAKWFTPTKQLREKLKKAKTPKKRTAMRAANKKGVTAVKKLYKQWLVRNWDAPLVKEGTSKRRPNIKEREEFQLSTLDRVLKRSTILPKAHKPMRRDRRRIEGLRNRLRKRSERRARRESYRGRAEETIREREQEAVLEAKAQPAKGPAISEVPKQKAPRRRKAKAMERLIGGQLDSIRGIRSTHGAIPPADLGQSIYAVWNMSDEDAIKVGNALGIQAEGMELIDFAFEAGQAAKAHVFEAWGKKKRKEVRAIRSAKKKAKSLPVYEFPEPSWVERSILIGDEEEEIATIVRGVWAVHKDPLSDDSWRVSHAPSGLLLFDLKTEDDAHGVVEDMISKDPLLELQEDPAEIKAFRDVILASLLEVTGSTSSKQQSAEFGHDLVDKVLVEAGDYYPDKGLLTQKIQEKFNQMSDAERSAWTSQSRRDTEASLERLMIDRWYFDVDMMDLDEREEYADSFKKYTDPTSSWRRKSVEVDTMYGIKTVDAMVNGVFALLKKIRAQGREPGGWQVIHLPSKMRIIEAKGKARAKKAVDSILSKSPEMRGEAKLSNILRSYPLMRDAASEEGGESVYLPADVKIMADMVVSEWSGRRSFFDPPKLIPRPPISSNK